MLMPDWGFLDWDVWGSRASLRAATTKYGNVYGWLSSLVIVANLFPWNELEGIVRVVLIGYEQKDPPKIPSRQRQDPPSVSFPHGGHLSDLITFFGVFHQPRHMSSSSQSDSQMPLSGCILVPFHWLNFEPCKQFDLPPSFCAPEQP